MPGAAGIGIAATKRTVIGLLESSATDGQSAPGASTTRPGSVAVSTR